MRAERRRRVTRMSCWSTDKGGANDTIKALRDCEERGVAGLATGEGQSRSRGDRRGVDRGLRSAAARQPVQAVEPDEQWELLPTTGAEGGDPEGGWPSTNPGHFDSRGSDRPNGGGAAA